MEQKEKKADTPPLANHCILKMPPVNPATNISRASKRNGWVCNGGTLDTKLFFCVWLKSISPTTAWSVVFHLPDVGHVMPCCVILVCPRSDSFHYSFPLTPSATKQWTERLDRRVDKIGAPKPGRSVLPVACSSRTTDLADGFSHGSSTLCFASKSQFAHHLRTENRRHSARGRVSCWWKSA